MKRKNIASYTHNKKGLIFPIMLFFIFISFNFASAGYYDLNNVTLTNTYNIAGKQPLDICFSPDGMIMVMMDFDNPQSPDYFSNLTQFNLNSPYNISSAVENTHVQVGNYPTNIYCNSEGTLIYIPSTAQIGKIEQFNFSEPWNMSTISQTGIYTPDNNLQGIYLNQTGDKMFFTSRSSSYIASTTLSIPFDLNTAIYDGINIAFRGVDIHFSTDGLKLFGLTEYENDTSTPLSAKRVVEYDLLTPFNLSSASYNQTYDFDSLAYDGIWINPDGTKLYSTNGTSINEYTLFTVPVIEIEQGLGGGLLDLLFNYGRDKIPTWVGLLITLTILVMMAQSFKIINLKGIIDASVIN